MLIDCYVEINLEKKIITQNTINNKPNWNSLYLPSGKAKPFLQVALQPDTGWHFNLESAGGLGNLSHPGEIAKMILSINFIL